MNFFSIFIGAVLVNNFVLAKFLGICPFLGVSKKVETALGMGVAVTFVMTLASIMTYLVQVAVLDNFGLEYLQTIAFILIIASLVQFVEMFLKKSSPSLYEALGVYLPLITTNCAVLGLAILNIQEEFNLMETIVNSLGAAVGFTLALITAGLMSIAFLGFSSLSI